eukprot:COSAG06_NODE_3502_length_5253_cov_2.040109_12_plen_72_part_01
MMTMTIRAEIRRSVGRGDEGRRPRVAVALGLLRRPRRTGQSGRGGARGRRVTLFQPIPLPFAMVRGEEFVDQ